MRYHALSGCNSEIMAEEFAIFEIKLSFWTNNLLPAQFKKLVHIVQQFTPFLSDIVHLLFAGLPPVLKKQENLPSIHPHVAQLFCFGPADRAEKLHCPVLLHFTVLLN